MKPEGLSQQVIIKNRAELAHGELGHLRMHVMDILEAGIQGGDPGWGTFGRVRLNGRLLQIGEVIHNLDSYRHLYLVGSGKGSFPIAEALEKILGDRLNQGILVVKRGEKRRLRRIKVLEAGHPLPDQDSLRGAEAILRLVDQSGPNDLVLAAITGGSSALTTLPPPGIELEDIQLVGDLLLKSGAVIREVNTVRRHLCQLKGGRLAQRIQPAIAVTLTLDTAPEGMPWPDMCLPDPTTFSDAIDVLKNYHLWQQIPSAVRKYLIEGTSQPGWETVKSFEGMRTQLVAVCSPISMCEAAAQRAQDLGYQAVILATGLEGEAREAGILSAGIVKEVLLHKRPFKPPCALISGGETTVTISGRGGLGGPNQEFVLGFAAKLVNCGPWVCASLDSDGTDGPTDFAGGLVDSKTANRAKERGVDLAQSLREHDSSIALQKLGGNIRTGHTGTNLQNLRVLLIP